MNGDVQAAAAAVFEVVDVALDPCVPLSGVVRAAQRLPARFGIRVAFGNVCFVVRGGDQRALNALREATRAIEHADMSSALIAVTFFKLPWPPLVQALPPVGES